MATFILLSTLTDDGAKTIQSNPERIKAVNQELGQLGVRVVNQWAVLGPYDFVNVVEAQDTQTVARVSAELASRGSVRVQTLAAIPIDEFIAGLGASAKETPSGAGAQRGGGAGGIANPIQVEKFLKGMDYPASKRDLIQTARREGADSKILSTLERLPDRSYQGPTGVAEEIGKLS